MNRTQIENLTPFQNSVMDMLQCPENHGQGKALSSAKAFFMEKGLLLIEQADRTSFIHPEHLGVFDNDKKHIVTVSHSRSETYVDKSKKIICGTMRSGSESNSVDVVIVYDVDTNTAMRFAEDTYLPQDEPSSGLIDLNTDNEKNGIRNWVQSAKQLPIFTLTQ